MTRDDFEMLLSDWLDGRDCDALSAAIRSAVDAEPGLRQVRDEWLRVDELLRHAEAGQAAALDRVRWPALKTRILSRVDALVDDSLAAGDDGLDAAIAGATALPAGVRWESQRRRVAAAINSAPPRSAIGVPRLRRVRAVAGGVLGLAAAALLALAFRAGGPSSYTPQAGRAFARIESSVDLGPRGGAIGVASVEAERTEETEPAAPCMPQILLIIDAPGDQPGGGLTISRLDTVTGDREVTG